MANLKEKLAKQIPLRREEMKYLVEEHGDKAVSRVTVRQVYGGLRGVRGMVCDTSSVEPDQGLMIRGIPIKKLTDRLAEEILFLLLTGELPSKDELTALQKELQSRAPVPDYVWSILQAMPPDTHPMTMLNTAILGMQRESVFAKKYEEGMKKDEMWEAALEDCLNIIARIPTVAAGIYRMRFKKGERIESNPGLDWGADFAHMLGLPDPDGNFRKLIRLYMVLHSDHEGGNVSAFAANTVGSALADLYYSLSSGLNGLAGPLHGLANQECLRWVLMLRDKFAGVPTDDQLKDFTWQTLKSGQVVPGYGHAVLRITDPRFDAFLEFGKKYCSDDQIVQIVVKIFEIVPEVLKQVHKIKDPWPNVDAASGAMIYHFGMTEFPYYTVLFSVSRAMGICAQNVIARALGLAIVRPKSSTTQWIRECATLQEIIVD